MRTFEHEWAAPATEMPEMRILTFRSLRAQNVSRLARWHGDDDGWTLADWSNAMCGEAGEAANVVKKIRRTDSVLWDKQQYPGDGASAHAVLASLPAAEAAIELRQHLANELADVICYADLLAHHAGIDLAAAVAAKFNRVSEAQGFPERL
jgi:NTP pyrophosphatase (non-canonical NTP hydrolase)